MRMKSLILIFIALGCGLVASIGISQVMDRGGSSGNMEMEQILVALADIDIGAKLDAQNVKLEDWPKAKVPEGAVRRLEDISEKFANARFFKGEPIHISKVTDQLGNIATKVPAGYRAMPVKVDEDTVMKAISPGDRVDVMVFLRRNGQEIPVTGAFTILKNVRVFAVNTSTERAADSKDGVSNFRTVSLLVKPEHARELVVAAQMGKIMLTLRRPDEQDDAAGEEVTPIEEILSGNAKLASEPTPVASPAGGSAPGSGFLGFVKSVGQTMALPVEPAAASAAPVEPEWVMEVLGPAERKRFEWTDKKGLPVESTVGPPAAAPAAATAPATPDAPSGSEGQPLDEPKVTTGGAGSGAKPSTHD